MKGEARFFHNYLSSVSLPVRMFATTLSNVAATVTENGLPLSYNCWTVEEEGSEYL